MIAIIDYDAGNLRSVQKAFEKIGETAEITRDKNTIHNADRVVLPGVGSFGDCMEKLYKYELVDTVKDVASSGKPFLGICLGMQLLFEFSEEAKGASGLSILKGGCRQFPLDMADAEGYKLKVPQIGWNNLILKNEGRLFKGFEEGPYVYFVHSYYLSAEDESVVRARASYGIDFDVSVEKGNIFGCQFHPEKSGDAGLRILKNFVDIK